ncbi:MAG: dihydrofolate reductase [Prevotella sp.]|nr:dihydrofolate reductase [Prevotella sp.]
MNSFNFSDECFADIQMLRYRLKDFSGLSLQQKKLVYYLSQATLFGRDITFDQNCAYNLEIRKMLEAIYIIGVLNNQLPDESPDDAQNKKAFVEYLKRVWFSNGIHHHYGCEKFTPGFSQDYLRSMLKSGLIPADHLPLHPGEDVDGMIARLFPVIFDSQVLPKRVNKQDDADLVATSACNFYRGVTQEEVEHFYGDMKQRYADDDAPMSYGLNSTLVKEDGFIKELTWKMGGMYGKAIEKIVFWLEKAVGVAENERQKRCIEKLVEFYRSGDLRIFNDYCIEWVGENDAQVDFINGFIEVYGDPMGLKATWEGLVEYNDREATLRTQLISRHAQWFENNSPVDPRFRKPHVTGVSAKAICAAMLGGEEYPSTAIGINLPNADWIRAQYGSKSVSISNITEAYNESSGSQKFQKEFVIDEETRSLIARYGNLCDALHTDLHECLGHGSGQLLPGVDPDALKAYSSTIEEARADLFGLYYLADDKLVELGLTPDGEAYKSSYYTYMMNGMLTQLCRIKPGHLIEEAHMRNRSLIARWCFEHGKEQNLVELVRNDGKLFVKINDYAALRQLIATLLAEVQRIKSEGDYQAAHDLVEAYAVSVDKEIHEEILSRYRQLNLAPYKGFINPVLIPSFDEMGNIVDVDVDYTEKYDEQMLRYSRDYATLI